MDRNTKGSHRGHSASSAYERSSEHYQQVAKKRSKKKRAVIIVCAVLAVLFVGVGTASAAYYFHIADQLNRGDKTQEELDALDDVLETTEFDEPFYMMLLGSDARSDDPSMGARSDTNVVVRVDAPKGELTLVSIPRDTRIEIEGHGVNKFNAAYAFGKAPGAIEAAEELLDVDISHYAEVNFESLVDLVDAVGGVDVEVEEAIDDPKADLDYNTHHSVIDVGEQHLDGLDALAFARSRAFASGDFTRASHQRQLIEAIIDKVLSAPLTSMPSIIEKASKCVTTDLSVSDIVTLAQMFKEKGDITMYSAGLPSEAAMIGGVSYVILNEPACEAMMELVRAGKDPADLDLDDYPMPSYDYGQSDATDTTAQTDATSAYDPNDDPYGDYSTDNDLYGYGGANTSTSSNTNAATNSSSSSSGSSYGSGSGTGSSPSGSAVSSSSSSSSGPGFVAVPDDSDL